MNKDDILAVKTPPRSLFGQPEAETLAGDLQTVVEQIVDDELYLEAGPVAVYEWSTVPNRSFFPEAHQALDLIIDLTVDTEVDEFWFENLHERLDRGQAELLIEAAITDVAEQVTYWMADKHINTYYVTVVDDKVVVGTEFYIKVSDE